MPLAVLLALAAALIVAGVAMLSVPLAFIVGGALLAVWACLFLLDVSSGP
jgi:hypothetical protein